MPDIKCLLGNYQGNDVAEGIGNPEGGFAIQRVLGNTEDMSVRVFSAPPSSCILGI